MTLVRISSFSLVTSFSKSFTLSIPTTLIVSMTKPLWSLINAPLFYAVSRCCKRERMSFRKYKTIICSQRGRENQTRSKAPLDAGRYIPKKIPTLVAERGGLMEYASGRGMPFAFEGRIDKNAPFHVSLAERESCASQAHRSQP